MSNRAYTILTVEVDGFTEGEKGSKYHEATESLEKKLNELASKGWKIVGQSLLAGKPQRLFYTLERKDKHQH
jgi:hypothetical protein